MAKMRRCDEVKGIIADIKKQGWETFETQTGMFYIADKEDYYFHLYFVYNDEVYKSPTYDEIYYNLKDRKCWLRRNDKDLTFSEDNIRKSFGYMSSDKLGFLETDGNAGLYGAAFNRLGKMYSENTKMVSRFLVRLMNEYPVLENIHKAGLDIERCFNDLVNKTTMNINEALGFQYKSQLKLYRRGASRDATEQKLSASFVRNLTEEDVLYLFKIRELAEKLDRQYGLSKANQVFNFNVSAWGRFGDSTWQSFLREIQDYDKTRIKKLSQKEENLDNQGLLKPYQKLAQGVENRLIEYLFYELDVRQGITNPSGAMNEYKDFVRMSSALGQTYERYPKSLRMRHDIAMKYYNLARTLADSDSFKKSYDNIRNLEGKIGNSGYSIIIPASPEDVIDEGEQLSHCVKSYLEAIANGVCQIVFLRKTATPKEALFTVELRQNAIVQFAGFQNCEPDDDAKNAITKWAKASNLIENWEGQTT